MERMNDAVAKVSSMIQSAGTRSDAVQEVPLVVAAPSSVFATSVVTFVPIVPTSGSIVVASPEVVANATVVPVDGAGHETDEVDWALQLSLAAGML